MNIFNLTKNYHPLEQESILNIDRALMENSDIFYGHHHLLWLDREVFFHSSAYQYINQVPVFLVSKELVGKTFDFNFVGHHLKFTVPNDNLPTVDLNGDVESILGKDLKREEVALEMPARAENEDKNRDKDKNNDIVEVPYEPFKPVANIDLWGLYIGAGQPIHNFRNAHPMIFIWIDKIQDYTHSHLTGVDFDYYINLFTCQVILHEMMHALMDINIIGYRYRHTNNIPEWFRLLREESLAEAGSLMLMDGVWKKRDIDFLRRHVSSSNHLFQYRLGSCYFKAGNYVVERAIYNWLERNYNQKLAEDWLRYLKGAFPEADEEQLDLYEEGFSFPYVFKYQSSCSPCQKLYSRSDLVLQVIREYAKSHKTSKSELMTVFPDTLNTSYEVFIDPQIKDHFTDKEDNSSERSISENQEVKCSDGKLIVCDYWHPSDMPSFVKHARDLGFDITVFWKE